MHLWGFHAYGGHLQASVWQKKIFQSLHQDIPAGTMNVSPLWGNKGAFSAVEFFHFLSIELHILSFLGHVLKYHLYSKTLALSVLSQQGVCY